MRKRGFHLISGLVVLSILGAVIWLTASSVSTLATLTPTNPGPTESTAQPSSDTEIVNSMRGQYRWGGTNKWGSFDGQLFPSAANPGYRQDQQWPGSKVSYYRFTWSEVQPGQDDFTFKRIEEELASSTARGEKLGFRVMPADNCCAPLAEPLAVMPAWLTDLGVNQWTYRGFDSAAVVPDWNNETYLAAMTKLIAKLGEKYDGDPRVAFVDMTGYGNFGEWHSYPMNSEYPRSQGGQSEISDANLRRLVDANLQAFKRTRLLTLATNPLVLARAMSARPDVGIRIDCLGDATGGSALVNISSNAAASNRWKTAPIVTEWCTSNFSQPQEIPAGSEFDLFRADLGQDLYQVGREQVRRWRISMLSSGNFPFAFNGNVMSDRQWQDFAQANKLSGYRYSAKPTSLPAQAKAGGKLQLATSWTNSGVAPTYEEWKIRLELRSKGSTTAISSTESSMDLRQLYAADAGTGAQPAEATQTVTDQLAIPASAAAGEYEVIIRLEAADNPPQAGASAIGFVESALDLDTTMPQPREDEYTAGTVSIGR